MTNAICNETLLTIFANLTPWVQGVMIGGAWITMLGIVYLFTRSRRSEMVHYVAQAKPEG